MPLFDNFPYTNLHDLNLDWAIQKLKELFTRGESLYAQLEAWQVQTNADLEAWKTTTMAEIHQIQTTFETNILAIVAANRQELLDDYQAFLDSTQATIDAINNAATETANARDTATMAANDARSIYLSIIDVVNGIEAQKVNQPIIAGQYSNGNPGDVLRSLGNGGTEWAAPGSPTTAQIVGAVEDWLADHPETVVNIQPGSITWEDFAADEYPFLTPQMFGAKGDGLTDDTVAVDLFIDKCIELNKIGIVPSGTYILYRNSYSPQTEANIHRIPVGHALHLIGCGRSSLFKRADNCVSPPSGDTKTSTCLFSIKSAEGTAGSADLIIEHVDFDANYSGQLDAIAGGGMNNNYSHTLVFTGSADAYLNAYFNDTWFMDPIADGLSYFGTISGTCPIISINNFNTPVRNNHPSGRSDICFNQKANCIYITNSYAPDIKMEPTGTVTTSAKAYFSNVKCNNFAWTAGSAHQDELHAVNLECGNRFAVSNLAGPSTFSNSIFASGYSGDNPFRISASTVRFYGCRFTNNRDSLSFENDPDAIFKHCTFFVPALSAGSTGVYVKGRNVNSPWPQFEECEFVSEKGSSAAIYQLGSNARATIRNCRFSGFEYVAQLRSESARPNPTLTIEGINDIGNMFVAYVSGSTWHINGNGFLSGSRPFLTTGTNTYITNHTVDEVFRVIIDDDLQTVLASYNSQLGLAKGCRFYNLNTANSDLVLIAKNFRFSNGTTYANAMSTYFTDIIGSVASSILNQLASSVTTLGDRITAVDAKADTKLPWPVTSDQIDHGLDGDTLTSAGDGTTEWTTPANNT